MRLLGIDYGTHRIGVALSDPLGMIATPLTTIHIKSAEQSLNELVEIIKDKNIEKIVLGLPLNMNGSEGSMVEKVKKFAEELQKIISLPIEFSDERLSSSLVEKTLLEADISRKKRKNVRDKLAAQVILQGYIDTNENNIF